MKTLNIIVEGMSCGGCVNKITTHFQTIESISSTEINLDDQAIEIRCEDDLSNMLVRNDLIELGFSVKSIKKT